MRLFASSALLVLLAGTAACGTDAAPAPVARTTATPTIPSTPGPSQPEDPGWEVAAAFLTYAEGGPPDVPWADVVTYSIGGEDVAKFDAGFAGRPETWTGCPRNAATYEGRDCPISPLRSLRLLGDDGVAVVEEFAPPSTVGCARYTMPPVSEAVTITWLRPDTQHRDCFTDLAVAVSVDDHGRLVAVDLVLSGP